MVSVMNKIFGMMIVTVLGLPIYIYAEDTLCGVDAEQLKAKHSDQSSTQLFSTIADMESLKANFTQKLINTNQDFEQKSKGVMSISKPHNFKWETTSPNEQLLVSNGKKLWNYDKALEQVTIQPVPKDISKAPYLLLLTGKQSALTRLFKIYSIDNQQYVLIPKMSETSMIKCIRMGFEGQLIKALLIETEVGQNTSILFTNRQKQTFPDGYFDFVPPKGVDVLG